MVGIDPRFAIDAAPRLASGSHRYTYVAMTTIPGWVADGRVIWLGTRATAASKINHRIHCMWVAAIEVGRAL